VNEEGEDGRSLESESALSKAPFILVPSVDAIGDVEEISP
jgi:hypothetical protein